MHAASLNHVYRLVWSEITQTWVAVAETGRSRGKAGRVRRTAASVLMLAAASAMASGPLPTGGQITQGAGHIGQNGATLTVTQSSDKLVTNWNSFSIGAGQTVQFIQPSASSVALNRVLGSEASHIHGQLKANGQVYLLNPNGVLFGASARVDTGGLLASTLAMSDADFLAGRIRLSGDSQAGVRNDGQIVARQGGPVALIAAKVINQGGIEADGGTVALASGQEVTLDLGGSVSLQVQRGALDSLIENGGAIRADGGHILLTARAADALSRSVINQTGALRARTLSTGAKGEIVLLGDMAHGQLNAGGQLDASAPEQGDGGFIETSAAYVDTQHGLQVRAGSAKGAAGTWLIDPYDYIIDGIAAGNIASTLNSGTNVTVTTQSNVSGYGSSGSNAGSGDITVNSAITKSGGGNATLTLRADRSIYVNSAITSTSGQLGITLSAANNASSNLGGVTVAANMASNGGRILIGGAGGNQTSATSYGIGYAINSASGSPAVTLGLANSAITISAGGGDITINGRSSANNSGSYSATKGGIYVLSNTTVDTGGGMLYMSGVSAGPGSGNYDKVFGFGVEASAGSTTTFKTGSTSGAIVVDATNNSDALGALGLVNNGSQARVQFWAPSVAHMLFRINGNNKATVFTQNPPCNPGYPNCGTMVIPGGNQSYTSAGYNVVNMAMNPLYVFTGNGSRVYDGSSAATGLTPTFLGGPNGFAIGNLGTLGFSTGNKAVGSYTTLTGDAANPSTYTSGGTDYAVAYYSQGTYTITQKTLNSFSAGNKTYDGTTAANVTSSGLVNGDAVTVNATGGFASAGVGNGITVNVTGVSLTGADAGNYTVSGGGNITTTANITPASLTVTANNASKTYDGLAYSGNNGVSYSGLVNGETSSVLTGTLSYGGNSQGAINAGTHVITPSGLSASNYSISYVNGALTVTPATLTYTANTASRTYGASDPAFSGNVSGFVNGETLASSTTGTASFGSTAISASHAGSHAITGSGLTANNGNYTFVQAAGNGTALTITPAALTVTAAGDSKTYDGLGYSGGNGVSYSGFVNGDTSASLGGTLAYGGNSQGALNAGSYVLTPSGLTSSNYSIGYVSGALTVNPATLTYTANAASRSYGAGNPSLSGSVTGFVNGETLASSTTGTLAFGTAATTGSNVGSYGITGSGLSANNGNYTFSQAGGNASALTVNPATLIVTAANVSKTYDGLAYSGGNGVSYSGFVNGETAAALGGALSYGGNSQGAINAGTHVITPSGLSASNYSISYVNGALTVNPATLTYTANTASRTYGAGNPAFSGSVTGFVNGETLASSTTGTLAFGTAATTGSNVGSYGITGSGLSANNGNYTFSQAGGNASALTVNPATLIVTADNASKTYDGLAYSGGNGVSYSGFVNGETAAVLGGTLSYGGSSQGAVNAGSYAIAPTGLSASNYSIQYVNGGLNISPAALAVITGNLTGHVDKVYDGTTTASLNSSHYQLSGWVGSDGATVTKTAGTYDNANAGSGKTVTVSLAQGDFSATGSTNLGNYTLPTSVTGTVGAITPASLTVTAANASKTYDGQAYSGGNGVSYSGFVNGETAAVLGGTLSYGGGSQGAVNAGSYAIVPTGLSASNYDIQYTQGALSINQAALTVISGSLTGSVSKVYDGTSTATLNPGNYLLSGWVNADGATVTKTAGTYDNANAGGNKTVTVSLGGSDFSPTGSTNLGNYQLPTSVSGHVGSITPAPLLISATSGSKTYDGTSASGATPTVSGLVGNDSVTGLLQAYANKNAGTGKAIGVTGYTVNDGNGGANYAVTTVGSTSGVILKAGASLTGTARSTTYNGGTQTQAAATRGGFLDGDDITVGGLASGRNTGTYTSDLSVSGSDAGNYDVSVTNADLVITPAVLTVAVSPATRPSGAANPGFTSTVTGFVGEDTLASATQGQMRFTTTANTGSGTGSHAIVGSGLTALHDNYIFVQAPGNATALTITAALPVLDQYLPKTAPVPNFPDNAASALGPSSQNMSGGNLNYVSVSSGSQASLAAKGAAPASTSVLASSSEPSSVSAERATGDQARGDSAAGGEAGQGGNGRTRTARPGVAATAVPSANGPLDIFVVDGGLNVGRDQQQAAVTLGNADGGAQTSGRGARP